MADDGSSKGHGGKPGRKSTVISMSAHKSRHSAESDSLSKKHASLTIFDLSPSAPSLDEVADVSASLGGALPCENTPFELDSSAESLGTRVPGRKFLRWGLEDPGPSETFSESQNNFAGKTMPGQQQNSDIDFWDDEVDLYSQTPDAKGQKWQHKSSPSSSVVESFYHAIHGLKVGFTTQRNVRIHCAISAAVLILALILKVDAVSSLALILATGFVLFAEYVNTALEHVTDIQANYRYHRSARYAKDTAAAAVLIAALAAVLIGLIVFVPRLIEVFGAGQL